MVAGCAGFAVMMVCVRAVSAELHPFVAAFWRNVLGLMFMMPWIVRAGPQALRSARWPMHGLRAGLGLTAMLFLFSALSRMPVAEATALTFTAPLFATIGAVLLLGERVRIRRWSATIVGFVGALIILRPGVAAVQPAAFLALAAAAFMATAMLTIKSLSRTENPNTIVVIMGLLMTPGSFVPAAFVWSWPSAGGWTLLLLMGLAATCGQIGLTRAFAAADASAVLPFDFSRLIFVAALGYLLFNEVPDIWTWVGAAVVVTSTVYIARREARLGRPTPPVDVH
jgi:drug/metabolite transporter (DMT)-like permease